MDTVLVIIKLTKFAVALRLRCGSCKLIFLHYFMLFGSLSENNGGLSLDNSLFQAVKLSFIVRIGNFGYFRKFDRALFVDPIG